MHDEVVQIGVLVVLSVVFLSLVWCFIADCC